MLKDRDFVLGFCGVDLSDILPCFFSETSEPIGFSWKAEMEFHWRNTSKEKMFPFSLFFRRKCGHAL